MDIPKFDKKQSLLIAAGIAVTVVVCLVLFAFVPMQKKIKAVNAEYKALDAELEIARMIVQEGNAARTTGRLLTRKEMPFVIDQITKIGKKFGVEFESIHPQPVKELKEFQCASLPIQLNMKTQYEKLGRFLGALEEIDEIIFSVRSLRMDKEVVSDPLITAELILEVFLEGKTDG